MTISKYLIAAVFVLMGAGCAKAPAALTEAEAPAPKRAPATRVEDAIFIVDGGPVALDGGVAVVAETPDSASVTTTRIFGEPVAADLDADGDLDAVVFLHRDSVGSGSYFYAAVALNEEGVYRGTEAWPLGDRIAPQTIEFRDGLVIANYADRLPEEPMTEQPSVGVSQYFRVVAGELEPVENP